MKKIIVLLLTLVLLTSCTPEAKQAGTAQSRYTRDIFGVFDTVVTLTAYCTGSTQFDEIYSDVSARLNAMNRLFDRYNSYPAVNNIKSINDSAGKHPVEIDPELMELLVFGTEAYEMTGGKVNIMMGNVFALWHDARENSTAPPAAEALRTCAENAGISHLILDRDKGTAFIDCGNASIDVGAIAKGFAAQKIAVELRAAGIKNFLLNCGGSSIAASGSPAEKETWSIGIKNPESVLAPGGKVSEQQLVETVDITDMCLGTSGDYQNYYEYDGVYYNHLIDPDTLQPARLYRAVTVYHENCAVADVLSTALFLLDQEKGDILLAQYGAKILRIGGTL